MDNKRILEALEMQPLSEEEKQQRHILGRLYGPIATSKESTRNERWYNADLWNKALNDEIFQEKIANKSLFLELGHPADREETDIRQACACIPEMPKVVDGDLYAYVDILDTPNGKLLKTLCDYGFVPGISSRGSGDIVGDNEVDPDTFYLETWDIVQLPAVKKARLEMCESCDPKKLSMKKALHESLKNSSEEDKKVMKEALDNLNINIEKDIDSTESDRLPGKRNDDGMLVIDAEEEFGEEANNNILVEENEDEEVENDDIEPEETEGKFEFDETETELDDEEAENAEVELETELADEEAESDEEEAAEEESPEEEENSFDITTVADLKATLDNFDEDAAVEFSNIEIDGVEYEAALSIDDENEEGTVILGVTCTPIETEEEVEEDETGDNEDIEEVEAEEIEEVEEAESDDEEADDEEEETTEEVIDDEDEEVMESLKEAIRQKNIAEKELKILKSKKTVGDAEVKGLKEELEKYKSAFNRMSELAGLAGKYKKLSKKLQESLTQKETEIERLKTQNTDSVKMNESIESNARKVKMLTEELNSVKKESNEKEQALTEELAKYKAEITKRTNLAKSYKAKANSVLESYIRSKASMLGVRPTEITSRLNESFSVADIDKVCDNILTESVNMNKLPFGNDRRPSVKVREHVEPRVKSRNDMSYDIDDSLLELAGLEKGQF